METLTHCYIAYRYQREFTYDQLIVNMFRRCFLSLKKESDSLKVEQFEMSVATYWTLFCRIMK